MTKPLDVFFCERAPVQRSQWLQNVLQPLTAACRMTQPVSVEVRPTGSWGGWCQDSSRASDGRICLTSRIVFWSSQSIKVMYLHESVHRLLEGREIKDHGPEFLCLLMSSLLRASSFFELGPLNFLTLYDFQDRPPGLEDDEDWRSVVLNWSLRTAAKLANTDATAESLASVVCQAWQAYLIERQAEKAAAAKAAAASITQRKKLTEQVVELKNSRTLWRCMAGLGWVSFTGLSWSVIRGFQ